MTNQISFRAMTKDIKADTQEIRTGTSAIKSDTTQILAEIARLQQQLPQDANQQNTSGFMLERYLDNLTTYAETVCDSFPDLESPSISSNDEEDPFAGSSGHIHGDIGKRAEKSTVSQDPHPPYLEMPRFAPLPPISTLGGFASIKEIQLFNGNLVLDIPALDRIRNQVLHA